jgi:hypothetical protein
MYILFLPRVVLYVTKFYPERKRGLKSSHKGLPVVRTIYTYGFHELFLKQWISPRSWFLFLIGHVVCFLRKMLIQIYAENTRE